MFGKKNKETKNERAALPRTVRKKVSLYGCACICFLIVAVIVATIASNLNSEIKARESENEEYRIALADVESLQNTLSEKKALVKKNGNTISSPILDEQTLYSYIANAAAKFNLTIGFVRQNGKMDVSNGVATQHYELLLTGSDSNLKLMLDSLETLPSTYTIEALSFRVETDMEWVKRAIDANSTYGWYETAEEGAKNASSSTNVSGTDDGVVTTLADMLDYEAYTLYLDIAFVSTN